MKAHIIRIFLLLEKSMRKNELECKERQGQRRGKKKKEEKSSMGPKDNVDVGQAAYHSVPHAPNCLSARLQYPKILSISFFCLNYQLHYLFSQPIIYITLDNEITYEEEKKKKRRKVELEKGR